ncbi:unnamed protein product [Brassica rapa]|uniref:Phosphatase PP2A regulatory subunit A/Splicing factor 3B subunit 1-like HEAT repeat domain-containing protein n=1 Tax=Brassica campestris TaxID=3711 RepID=A0A3P5YI09_BRACM|nr:unnamed protein product [Brassica rapa]VDC60481.1 unnamed protein product [Brassica rapa]
MSTIEEPLYPIVVLIDELKNDDIQLRLNSIRRLSTIARALGEEKTRKELIPFLSENNEDDDEVLLAMAEELGVFIPYAGGVEHANDLLPPLETLSTVEEKAVESLCRVGTQMRESELVDHFLPLVKELSSDSSQHIKSALASVIMGMAPVLGKDATIEHLLPIFLSLLKDEFPDVCLNIISKLDQVNQVIGIDLLSRSLLPAIVLASSTLCMQWLQDKVHSIRDAAANNLKRLAEEFGHEWAMQHIVPQFLEMINNPHYLYRMTILRAVSLLAPVIGSEITCSKLLPVVITASKDRQYNKQGFFIYHRVPNIKFNVAKVLQSLIPIVVENMIRPGLVELSEDPDVDVRFFANQALQSIDNVMMSS